MTIDLITYFKRVWLLFEVSKRGLAVNFTIISLKRFILASFVYLAGLVETTLEHVKHLHAQMNMNSLQLGKGSSWRRKVMT